MVQLRSILIYPSNKQRNAKRSRHDPFILIIITLSKPQSQIAYGLCTTFDTEGFVIGKAVVLTLDTGMVDHGAGIGGEAGHGAADVGVDFDDFFDGGGFEEN
jgi:hypothetical protein